MLKSNLTEANLEANRNYLISPGENALTKARFSFPEVLSLLNSMDIVLQEEDLPDGKD